MGGGAAYFDECGLNAEERGKRIAQLRRADTKKAITSSVLVSDAYAVPP